MKSTLLILMVPLCSALLTSGCARDLNGRSVLGGDHAISALGASTPGERINDAPSLSRMDRSDWTPGVFRVPVDGTVHGPVRHGRGPMSLETPRQRGLFPTRESAIELGRAEPGKLVREAVLAPVAAIGEVLFMPVSLIAYPPPHDEASPRDLYKRYPDDGWTSAAAPTHTPTPVVRTQRAEAPDAPAPPKLSRDGAMLIESIR